MLVENKITEYSETVVRHNQDNVPVQKVVGPKIFFVSVQKSSSVKVDEHRQILVVIELQYVIVIFYSN
jgi:hypothetical protein